MLVRVCSSIVNLKTWFLEVFRDRRLTNDIIEECITIEKTKEGVRTILRIMNVTKERISSSQKRRKGWREESKL
ncbi:hypothetical protein AXF42_Ash008766 [Apostasia shenzhenica]|uniref:Uncharacterized protein n=1 Tax=Apostasia shenzhenica TaxID=1088818 RepID=A0A2I0ASE7_9ASPA|nr:hypothetical protein AXF42_Ash008766 [Apostasia shenzhenica]